MGRKRKIAVSSSTQHLRKKVAVKHPAGKKKGLAIVDEVDFENPLAVVPLSSVNANETVKKRLPAVQLRTSPRPLWNCVRQLTEQQAALVKEMGFGKLLNFNVDGIPWKLGHYVVDKLDTKNMVLNLEGYAIKITKEVIHQLLGIPIGGVGLKDIDEAKLDKKLTGKWKSKYAKDQVSPTDIVKYMFSSRQTDWEFKIDFIMLFCATMVSSRKDGACNSTLVPYFPEGRNIRDIDWCAYVYDNIHKCKLSSKKNDRRSCFTGPVTVLTLLYLDSTKCLMFKVPRSQPALAEWNMKKIRMRQEIELKNGGFGLGEKQALFEAEEDAQIQDHRDNDANDNEKLPVDGTHVDDVSNNNDGDDDNDNDDDTGYTPSVDELGTASSHETGIVSVQGYKVKRSIAPILKNILKEHGDIAAGCLFKTDSVRSSFLEVVCEVVRRIQTDDNVMDKLEEIESQVSDAKAANIDVSWLQPQLEAIHSSKKYNLLMERKVNTMSVKQAAKMDLREISAELAAVQKRFKNAERCVKVLDIVEKNLNDNILESKAKMESWVKQF